MVGADFYDDLLSGVAIALPVHSVDRRWHFQRLVRRGFYRGRVRSLDRTLHTLIVVGTFWCAGFDRRWHFQRLVRIAPYILLDRRWHFQRLVGFLSPSLFSRLIAPYILLDRRWHFQRLVGFLSPSLFSRLIAPYILLDRRWHFQRLVGFLSPSLFSRLIAPYILLDRRWHFQRLVGFLSPSLFSRLIAPYLIALALSKAGASLFRSHPTYYLIVAGTFKGWWISIALAIRRLIAPYILLDRRWHFQRLVRSAHPTNMNIDDYRMLKRKKQGGCR